MNKEKLNKIFDELYPLQRSITGPGIRKSLNILKRYMDIKIFKVKSGLKIFDWIVPNEWELVDGYIKYNNKKILDVKLNNLHVINFSTSINKIVNLKFLKTKLFTNPQLKDAIPYVTSYYKKNWGFCMKQSQFNKLKNGKYKVFIETKNYKGFLNYGVSNLNGKSKKKFLLNSFLCHPSMANNELSGPLTILGVYHKLKKWENRNLNYEFLINPETIGSIAYLSKNKNNVKKLIHSGASITCMGGKEENLSYFKSRFSKSPLDRLLIHLSKKEKINTSDFDPSEGGDERQYCSAEFNLPIGRFERTGKSKFKEYHTSLDNKKLMNMDKIIKSINKLEKILLYNDFLFPIKRHQKYCEIFLTKHNLYPSINSYKQTKIKNNSLNNKIIMTLLSYADGNTDYLQLTEKFNFPIDQVLTCLKLLIDKKIIYLKL